MLAARLPSILPPLSPEEMLEVSMVHSLAGELMGGKLATERPFRAPHHSASMAALVGGGTRPRPGEVSLAHLGVLFLDELPEFQPDVLDALRQPLETGETVIARANHRIAYPSRIQLVAAMNPCKCGGGGPGVTCRRGRALRLRISGAHLRAAARPHRSADRGAGGERRRSRSAGADRGQRAGAHPGGARTRACSARALPRSAPRAMRTNAECSGRMLEEIAMPDAEGAALMRQAADALQLSARGFHRTLRVARTLADLDGEEGIGRMHVAEALSYRGETLRQTKAA